VREAHSEVTVVTRWDEKAGLRRDAVYAPKLWQ
jgi:hypothetical protein